MKQSNDFYNISFSVEHDSAVTILKNGKLQSLVNEERLCKHKHNAVPLLALKKSIDYLNEVITDPLKDSKITCCALSPKDTGVNEYLGYLTKICNYQPFVEKDDMNDVSIEVHSSHHLLHALIGYLRSGFDNAVVITIDGAGEQFDYGKEHETVMQFNGLNSTLDFWKKVIMYDDDKGSPPPYVEPVSVIGAGYAYSAITQALGYEGLDNGKTMGLSSYGKENPYIPKLIEPDLVASRFFRLSYDSAERASNGPRCAWWIGAPTPVERKAMPEDYRKDLAYRIQKDYEDYLIHLVTEKLPKYTNCKNIILTGGCALNCVANYKLRKALPKEYKLYSEPLCDDSCISLGSAVVDYLKENENEEGIYDIDIGGIYHGVELNYDYKLKEVETEKKVTPEEVAKLLVDGNIVAIAQGKSELGPRALGNRSILFDPRCKDGRDIVNEIKQREWFRPFAGTVMLEHAREWFDLDDLAESPHMTYAMDVWKDKQELIPAITHVDGTCRIQTVTKEQNENYFNLIEEFYKLTNIPMVLNTSFNLGGEPLVGDINSCFRTIRMSKIEYLYLPEIETLIYSPNSEKNIRKRNV